MVVLYALLALSILWSEHTALANFDMEVKMSFVLIPLIIAFQRYGTRQLKIIIYFFLFGLIIGYSELIFQAIREFLLTKNVNEFLYVDFSARIHPSYAAYYLNIAILILLFDYMGGKLQLFKKRWVYLVLIFGFTLLSFMLLSKGGIVASVLLVFALLIYWIVKKKFLAVFLVVVVSFFSIGTIFLKSQGVQDRTLEFLGALTAEKTDVESESYSTGLRLAIWKESIYLLKKEPWLGYGAGDVTSVLMERYDMKGLSVALNRQLNSHNQFLQTGLAVGVGGVILLFSVLFFPLFTNNKLKWLAFSFSGLTSIFFMTESVLETQAGVVGFVLFYSVFVVIVEHSTLDPKSGEMAHD